MQLDDLDVHGISKVRTQAFLILETSPGNYQAWIAVAGGDSDQARRLRKGVGADASASGATRIAGTVNFKRKYEPNLPTVRIVSASPGRIVPKDDLTRSGLLAPSQQGRGATNPQSVPGRRQWPKYDRCLQGAPPNHAGTAPDISRADFTWCMTAIDWGWSVEDTAARLMQHSSKARENGERYVTMTAQNAQAALERNRRSR